MSFSFSPVDETDARAVVEWLYPAPYDVYNLASDDTESVMKALTDSHYAYHAIADHNGGLVAFCCFGTDAQVPGGDYTLPAIDIGLGVRPDLTGLGRGQTFISAVLEFERARYGASTARVTIAAFNARAQRVWQKAGFRFVQRFRRQSDGIPFLILLRECQELIP